MFIFKYLWSSIVLVSVYIILLITLLFYTFFYGHESLHNVDWIKQYTGKNNVNCCGKHDCVPVKIRLLEQNATHGKFEIFHNGQTFTIDNFPIKGYHLSEDENDWFCFIVDGGIFDEFNHGEYVMEKQPCYNSPDTECINCIFISVKF